MLFFKKKGRTTVAEFDGESYKVGDILEASRPLRNYTPLNAAISAGLSVWWAQFCPDVEAIWSVSLKAVKWLAVFDCRNAFHRVGIHRESRRLCVSKYRANSGRTRLLQAKGGEQGVSAIVLGEVWGSIYDHTGQLPRGLTTTVGVNDAASIAPGS